MVHFLTLRPRMKRTPFRAPASHARRQAPQPPPRALRGAAAHELSVVAAFDELRRNAAVLRGGAAEEAMLRLVRRSALLRKSWARAEADFRAEATAARETKRELLAKEYKIQQARKMVEDERRGRKQAEAERDAFAKQVRNLSPGNLKR